MEIMRGRGSKKAILFKGKYRAALEFPEGWGDSNQKKPSMRGGQIFFLEQLVGSQYFC